MVVYALCACEFCGAGYASFWRDWAGVVVFYRTIDMETEVAELQPSEPALCTECNGTLKVTVPYAVRTRDGDWLALNLKQVERALAN